MPSFAPQLQSEYQRLFDTSQLKGEKRDNVEKIFGLMVQGQNPYAAIKERLGIPWFFTGIVHSMESDSIFKTHLHNGDALKARTVQVPSGRPKNGTPLFEWKESAEDALMMKDLHSVKDGSVTCMLFRLERYNGFGYRRTAINLPLPYLWSFRNRSNRVRFHKLAGDQLIKLWANWESAGLLNLVLTWGGSFAPRFVRGSRTTLSNHAFGSAFDINVAWNLRGTVPALVGQKGAVRELVPIAHANGFYWGGHFSRQDGMHFEIAQLQ